MENVLAPRSVPPPNQWLCGGASEAACSYPDYTQGDLTDHQFIAMLDAFRDSGGLAPAQEVVTLFKRCNGSEFRTLAGLIADKRLISFEWASKVWLPLFQFNRVDMTPQVGLAQVLAQLTAVFSAWELVNWFAQPNPWLGDRTPAAMLGLDLPAVLNASRAERFVVDGPDPPRTSAETGGQDIEYAN